MWSDWHHASPSSSLSYSSGSLNVAALYKSRVRNQLSRSWPAGCRSVLPKEARQGLRSEGLTTLQQPTMLSWPAIFGPHRAGCLLWEMNGRLQENVFISPVYTQAARPVKPSFMTCPGLHVLITQRQWLRTGQGRCHSGPPARLRSTRWTETCVQWKAPPSYSYRFSRHLALVEHYMPELRLFS